MDSNEILKADVLDILFDNRNKQYGAYTLRKYYPTRLKTSLLLAFVLVVAFLYLLGTSGRKKTVAKSGTVVQLTQVVIPPDLPKKIDLPDPPKQRATAAPQVAQERFVNRIRIVQNTDPTKTLHDIHDFDGKMISDRTAVGIPSTGLLLPPSNITGSGTGLVESKPEKDPEILPSSEPEFPGGSKAWLAFLNRYLAVPGELEPGEKKTVVIRFEVSANGSVAGFTVVQSPGQIYESEVIRVLKKMPKWKPAIQNGVPVTRSFTQPVTFMGVEF